MQKLTNKYCVFSLLTLNSSDLFIFVGFVKIYNAIIPLFNLNYCSSFKFKYIHIVLFLEAN